MIGTKASSIAIKSVTSALDKEITLSYHLNDAIIDQYIVIDESYKIITNEPS
jgi:hypothetical protein